MFDSITIRHFDCRGEFLKNMSQKWVAIDTAADFRVVGTVALEILEGDWGFINDLWVDPDYRGRGIGGQLVEAAEAMAATISGVVGTCCGINRKNFPSLTLFQHKGYWHSYSYPEGGSLLFSRQFAK